VKNIHAYVVEEKGRVVVHTREKKTNSRLHAVPPRESGLDIISGVHSAVSLDVG
jgi:hypothetical protein